jgi:hypothetical protein
VTCPQPGSLFLQILGDGGKLLEGGFGIGVHDKRVAYGRGSVEALLVKGAAAPSQPQFLRDTGGWICCAKFHRDRRLVTAVAQPLIHRSSPTEEAGQARSSGAGCNERPQPTFLRGWLRRPRSVGLMAFAGANR